MVVSQHQAQGVVVAPTNSIINNLKCLERAGSEQGRFTKKLLDATLKTANHVQTIVIRARLVDVDLPRGYCVFERTRIYCQRCGCGGNTAYVLMQKYEPVNGRGEYILESGNCYDCAAGPEGWEPPTREVALQFARDIANGWLGELTEFVRTQNDQSSQAIATLTAARQDG